MTDQSDTASPRAVDRPFASQKAAVGSATRLTPAARDSVRSLGRWVEDAVTATILRGAR